MSMWFWAHDIEDAGQLRDLAVPHLGLQRIANYRRGTEYSRRFVALYRDTEPLTHPRRAVIDVDQDTAVAYGRYAVALTADGDDPLTSVRFSLVLDHTPHRGRQLHAGLDLPTATALFASGAAIVDFATYRCDGDERRFAVITESHGPAVTFMPTVSPHDLTQVLTRAGLRPLLVRPYRDTADAVAVLAGAGAAVARAGLSADEVSQYLQRHRATPLDIDALGGPDGVRFSVVASPGRTPSVPLLRRLVGRGR